MTEQFLTPNINVQVPQGEREVIATGTANRDDDLVTFDSTAGAISFTLVSALQVPGQSVSLKANNAGTTGNAVTILPFAGQNIDGNPSVILGQDQDALTVKSDGANWRIMGSGGTAAAGGLVPTPAVFIAGTTANVGDRVRYDPTAGTFVITAPLAPVTGDLFAIKNVSIDLTAITVAGNGNNVEDVTTGAFGGTTSVTGAAVGITFQFDGTQWLIV